MRLYFAGPLFTTPERCWTAEVVAALRAAGHEFFLPQEKEPGLDSAGIFATGTGRESRSCSCGPTSAILPARRARTTR